MDQTEATREKVEIDTPMDLSKKVSESNRLQIGEVVNKLISERKFWQEQEFARSNLRLYQILQSCYVLYKSMAGLDGEKLALKRAFKSFCEEQGVKCNDTTHLMVRIVRCVFGDDRRRASNYATALRVALENKVGTLDIPKFFSDAGGVEEVRRSKNPNRLTAADKALAGKELMNGATLATVKSQALDKNFSEEAYYDAVLLVAAREADGSFSVKHLIQHGSIITSALAYLPTLHKVEVVKKQIELEAANDESIRESARQQAANA